MKLKDLVDRVRFQYKDRVYEFRKDKEKSEYDGMVWILDSEDGTAAFFFDCIHMITPSGFDLATSGKTWSFRQMRKLGFEYRVYSLVSQYIGSITAMNDADFAKKVEGGISGKNAAVRVTSMCPDSQAPKALDTSLYRLKKQQ
ncbi:MAG: hypothetical protein HUU01_14145 [Saprospiraceae bacterium]|nr:hypothetical protein [Saprospiraceae bacterium]